MQYHAFGPKDGKTLLLLHGGGLSWWSCREAAQLLQSEYRVLLPILDGHAGSGRPFTSIEDCAANLIAWIDRELGGSVLLIGGLSLGGQVLLEMLSRRGDVCRHALVESATVLPSRLTHALIGPSLACSYGLIRRRCFARLQFRSLRLKPELFEEYYRDSSAISRADMTAFLRANTAYTLKDSIRSCAARVHVYAGGKELPGVLRSAERIHEAVPGSTLTVLPGLYHGDFSINHPADYAEAVRGIVRRNA
ncbi:MAG: alpha/beta hydrolase [Clostridia bacterium]|nr:alpha/beta hydrolase [Clostridia bacterium]